MGGVVRAIQSRSLLGVSHGHKLASVPLPLVIWRPYKYCTLDILNKSFLYLAVWIYSVTTGRILLMCFHNVNV